MIKISSISTRWGQNSDIYIYIYNSPNNTKEWLINTKHYLHKTKEQTPSQPQLREHRTRLYKSYIFRIFLNSGNSIFIYISLLNGFVL